MLYNSVCIILIILILLCCYDDVYTNEVLLYTTTITVLHHQKYQKKRLEESPFCLNINTTIYTVLQQINPSRRRHTITSEATWQLAATTILGFFFLQCWNVTYTHIGRKARRRLCVVVIPASDSNLVSLRSLSVLFSSSTCFRGSILPASTAYSSDYNHS